MKEQIKLEKGLVLIRYVAPSVGKASAIMRASIDAKDAAKGQIVSDPFANEGELARPGQCIVVQCLAPLTLLIDVRSALEGEPPRGSVRVEYLTRSANASKAADRNSPSILPEQLETLKLVGHVAYRGDVTVDNGAWLCGPESPNRVEGIKLVWPDAPQGIEIAYRVSGGPKSQLGQYAGSKGSSAPISELEIWCEGPLASRVSLVVEALFVHAGLVAANGRTVKIAGRGAKDELIGLRVMMTPDDSVNEPLINTPSKRRIQIFRD